MPIYEYRCLDCRRVQSFLTLRIGAELSPECRFCGSRSLARLMSRVAVVESEASRLERMADPSRWGDLDEDDPRSVARFAKMMGEATGEDVGEEIDQILEQAESEDAGGRPESGGGADG
ncbi:MAG: zinc ribbon domain-containing protein [Gemmatimonadetes bacterium]|nr:zinc ribbon domain-containing protein [Gemmatimonadota bacterium]